MIFSQLKLSQKLGIYVYVHITLVCYIRINLRTKQVFANHHNTSLGFKSGNKNKNFVLNSTPM